MDLTAATAGYERSLKVQATKPNERLLAERYQPLALVAGWFAPFAPTSSSRVSNVYPTFARISGQASNVEFERMPWETVFQKEKGSPSFFYNILSPHDGRIHAKKPSIGAFKLSGIAKKASRSFSMFRG